MKAIVKRHAAYSKNKHISLLLAVCLILAMTSMLPACGDAAKDPEAGAAAEEAAGKADEPAAAEADAAETENISAAASENGDDPAAATLQSGAAVQAQPLKPALETSSAAGDAVESLITLSIRDGTGRYMLEASSISAQDGDTALDVLVRAGRSNGIPVVYSGTKKSAYVEGIGNLFEFDEGPESGWMYRINGEKPLVGCGAAALEAGDRVEWIYVTSLEEGFE